MTDEFTVSKLSYPILSYLKKQNTWILTRQSSGKVAYKPVLDYLLERFLLSTFAQVLFSAFCPKHFRHFLNWGELAVHPCIPRKPSPPPPFPRPVRLRSALDTLRKLVNKAIVLDISKHKVSFAFVDNGVDSPSSEGLEILVESKLCSRSLVHN